jgi:hypothetical protein
MALNLLVVAILVIPSQLRTPTWLGQLVFILRMDLDTGLAYPLVVILVLTAK